VKNKREIIEIISIWNKSTFPANAPYIIKTQIEDLYAEIKRGKFTTYLIVKFLVQISSKNILKHIYNWIEIATKKNDVPKDIHLWNLIYTNKKLNPTSEKTAIFWNKR